MKKDRTEYWAAYYQAHREERRLRYLNLSPEQREKIRAYQRDRMKKDSHPIKVSRMLGVSLKVAREMCR